MQSFYNKSRKKGKGYTYLPTNNNENDKLSYTPQIHNKTRNALKGYSNISANTIPKVAQMVSTEKKKMGACISRVKTKKASNTY